MKSNVTDGPERVKGGVVLCGEHEAGPFIDRWLTSQCARLKRRLSVCESPIETIFAVAVLSAHDARGPVFELATRTDGALLTLLATSRDGRLTFTAQHEVKLGRKAYRLDFTLISDQRRVVVELDGHAYHASKAARSADAGRDLALTKAGWTPVRFTGSDIWRDADGCAAKVLDLMDVTVVRGDVVSPARKPEPEKPWAPMPRAQKTTAASVLAALLGEGGGSGEIAPIRRPFLGRPGGR